MCIRDSTEAWYEYKLLILLTKEAYKVVEMTNQRTDNERALKAASDALEKEQQRTEKQQEAETAAEEAVQKADGVLKDTDALITSMKKSIRESAKIADGKSMALSRARQQGKADAEEINNIFERREKASAEVDAARREVAREQEEAARAERIAAYEKAEAAAAAERLERAEAKEAELKKEVERQASLNALDANDDEGGGNEDDDWSDSNCDDEPDQPRCSVNELGRQKGLVLDTQSQLPDGWKVAQDERGNTYYYNTTKGITQWERPEE